jgi:transposase
MNDEIRRRLVWVRMYEKTYDAGLVCRRCGISRPTLRKWVRRFRHAGELGLIDQSRRPQRSPRRKVFRKERTLILRLRRERNLGARRIQIELWLHWEIDLSILQFTKFFGKHRSSLWPSRAG